MKKNILITGSAGFIGFHLTKLLLEKNYNIIGIDALTDYYDVKLKKERLKILKKSKNFHFFKIKLENKTQINKIFKRYRPVGIIHLAAQAGVRHSIEHPEDYISTNIIGTFNILESCRNFKPKHILIASTSSVYGANDKIPFKETDKADDQVSIYAATKKSTEVLGHSYSYNFSLPITFFRFFTVYGPWGRPDMALFLFTKNILENKKINVFNYGKMYRDYTYVEDLVKSIQLLINKPPKIVKRNKINGDSISPVAPFRIINIGNSKKVQLIEFIKILEKELGKKAKINLMPMQQGDVEKTFADTTLLKKLTGYKGKTNIKIGIKHFVKWYKEFYKSY